MGALNKWESVHNGVPPSGIDCILLIKTNGAESIYPAFAIWDGAAWIDDEGDKVSGVVAWKYAKNRQKLG